MICLEILDAPKFYNCQFWAPSFSILAKIMCVCKLSTDWSQSVSTCQVQIQPQLVSFRKQIYLTARKQIRLEISLLAAVLHVYFSQVEGPILGAILGETWINQYREIDVLC